MPENIFLVFIFSRKVLEIKFTISHFFLVRHPHSKIPRLNYNRRNADVNNLKG